LKDPETGRIRYIGKSDCPKRRLNAHCRDLTPCYRTNWIRQLSQRGLRPQLEILLIVDFAEWPYWEKKFISTAKEMGIPLVNQTEGGEAPMAGKKHSLETRKLLGDLSRGHIKSQETRKKLSLAHRGRVFSKTHCENMAAARRGKKHSDEHKQKISAAELGEKNVHWGKFGKAHPAFGTKRNQSTSLLRGVSWDVSRKLWRATIPIKNRQKYLGRFKTEQEAHEARLRAESKFKVA